MSESVNPVYNESSVIVTDDSIYQIDLLPDDLNSVDEFKDDVAYLHGEYFYLYQGVCDLSLDTMAKKPGIYKSINDPDNKWIIIEPSTDEEKKEYNAFEKMVSLMPESIIDKATKDELLIGVPEKVKKFQPEITINDDILKRAVKHALKKKNVDIDACKDNFVNKNELFNFKQLIRGDAPMSLKIFSRGMEAMNLEYIVLIKEKDSSNRIVGNKLEEPIKVSSEETYDL